MVPNGWKKCSISEVAEVVTGSTPSTFDQNNYGSEYPFVSPTDLGLTKIVTKTQKYLSGQGFKASRPIPKGSALFTCIGSTIGKVGVAGTLLTTNQQINAVIPKEIDHDYLYYALCQISPRVKRLAGVQAVPIVNKSSFENAIIYAPISEIEQRQIAAILSTWDEAIEKTERLIEAKVDAKSRHLHLKMRSLDAARRVPLPHVSLVLLSNVDKLSLENEIPVKLCNYMDVYSNSTITSRINFMAATATQREVERFSLRKGDVLITKDSETSDDIAQAAVVTEELPGVLCGYHLALIRPKDMMLYGPYFARLFETAPFRKQFIRMANGVTRFGLGVEAFEKALVPLPDYATQVRLAEFFLALDEEIMILRRKVELLRKQKRGLMQKLLTGEWRVKVK